MTDNRADTGGTNAGLPGGGAGPFERGPNFTKGGWANKALTRNEHQVAESSSGDGDIDLLPDTNPMTTLEAAQALAASGIRIFPCSPRDKSPLIKDWRNLASASPASVKSQWNRSPNSAIGLPTGDAQALAGGAELVVLDLDVKNGTDGLASLQQVELELGPLPDTFTVSTPSGGRHQYFSVPKGSGLRNSASSVGPGIGVRASGGYVVAPGSELVGKGRYEVTLHLPVAALPDEWIARLGDRPRKQRSTVQTKADQGSTGPSERVRGTPYDQAALRDETDALRNAAPGTRNHQLNRSAFALGQLVARGDLAKEDVLFALMEACVDNHLVHDGFDAVRATIESGFEAGLAAPRDNVPAAGRKLTEDALALMFADRHEHQFLYDHTRGSWFFWDGSCWGEDQTNQALMACRDLIREKAAGVDVVPLNKTAVAKAVLTAAAADPRMRITHEDWNNDPWLLGVPGGIVDLKTGGLLPADPAKRINAQTLVAPAAPGAQMPVWQAFLDQATKGDAELQRFLQQMAGYALTGDMSEEIFFFIHGPGGNGKGVFIGALGAIMGDYAKVAPMQTFMASKNDRHLTELARLVDARLVTASETEEGRQLAVARIKELSGNERPIAANFMRQDHFEFVPRFKMVLVGNDKPKILSVDDGMRRRLRLVPFTHKPEKVDLELKEKLKAEYPAILRWAIEGCLDWKKNGFVKPAIIAEATLDYLEEEDVRAQWLAERTVKDSKAYTPSSELYASWEKWANERSESAGAPVGFSRWLSKQGYTSMKVKGERGFAGLRLKSAEEAGDTAGQMDG